MIRQAGRTPKLTSLAKASVCVMVWRTRRSDRCVCQLRLCFSHSHFNVSGPSVSLSLIIACDHCLCRYQTRCQGTLSISSDEQLRTATFSYRYISNISFFKQQRWQPASQVYGAPTRTCTLQAGWQHERRPYYGDGRSCFGQPP